VKARVSTRDLADALAAVKPAVGRDKPFVRLTTMGDQLEVAADDLRLGVRAVIGAWGSDDEVEVEVMVPFRPLAALAARSDEDDTELADLKKDADDALLTVRSSADMKLPMVDPSWFPQRPEPEGVTIDLDEDQWAAVRRLIPFASVDEAKPIYTGVWFGPEGVAASDDHQVGLLLIPFDNAAIVPAETLAAIREDGKVSVVVGDRSVKLTHSGGLSVTSSSIAGEPPKVTPFLEPGGTTITVGTAALTAALERCSLTARSIFGQGYKLAITPHKRGIEVRSQGDPAKPEGSTTEVVDAVTSGFDFELGINSAGLAAVMALVGEDPAVLHLGGPMKPIVCRSESVIGGTMPMRVD
jgi:DNA polymerase III sliding clamp (beta) subunit (PCNA family)